MRILLACEFYSPSVGGVQEVMRQLAERLVERGHAVSVATSFLPERELRELNGVTIVEFKVSGNLVHGLSGEIEAYRNHVLQDGYDVFMVKAAQQWTFDALLPVLGRMRKPKVFVPCGFSGLFEPAYAEYFRAMPEALRKFEHLIFYASDYRDVNFARSHGLTNFSIVPNGADEREFGVPIDPGFRRRHAIAEEAFVVLTVGTLVGGRKGHSDLAQAFALAPPAIDPAVLVLNGNSPPRVFSGRTPGQMLRRIAHLLKDGAAVRKSSLATLVARINGAAPGRRAMITDLPRSELVQAYLNSDLFVFASRIEYSPLVLYEAAAAGLPFLSVPVGNAAEIAEWTGGGVICPASRDERGYTHVDPEVLAEHIARLAADPAARAKLSEAGRRNWSEKYTWDLITDRYEAILAGLSGQNGRGASG